MAAVFDSIHYLFHDKRSIDEYEIFKKRYYKYIHEINYKIIGDKISDQQIDKISSADLNYDTGIEQTIRVYTDIISE